MNAAVPIKGRCMTTYRFNAFQLLLSC